jgi:hypothetical protein
MDKADPTSLRGEVPHIPDHLRPALEAAAELELELSSDGFWPDAPEERIAKRDAVMRAARVLDRWDEGSCTREQIALLAHRAAIEREPQAWPCTLAEVDDLIPAALLTRDLLLLRDALGGWPIRGDHAELE